MKNLILGVMMLSSTTLLAEGYQVNLQSTKQAGMAHVGTAMKLGAESMHFNPAALVYMKKNIDLSVGGTAVMATAKYNNGGYEAKTDNKVGTPFYVYAGFNIFKDKLAAGVSLTTPYGNSLNWGDNWQGASIVQNISLQSFMIQPTISFKIIDGLSIGAGLDVAWGNFELSRAAMTIDQMSASGIPSLGSLSGQTAASSLLSGNAKAKVGVNVGVMYDINDKLTIGLTYRSKIMMSVSSGDVDVSYLNETIKGIIGQPSSVLSALDKGTFNAELPLPSNTTFGISYKPTSKLLLAFDLQYTNWEVYDKLDINFNAPLESSSMSQKKNYKSTFAYRLGAQYEVNSKLDVRAGVYHDRTPVRSNNYNPETPGANKTGVSLGLSFRPCENLSIDVACTYINGAKVDGSYQVVSNTSVFAGEYKTYAFMPSLGISYNF